MKIRNKILSDLSEYHAHQTEFRDAAIEIFDDILEYNTKWTPSELYEYFYRLIEPDRSIRFRVEWFNDQGNLCVNRGYRIQFDNTLGPYKGGLRFHPTVNESILKFLGFEQIFKNALTGINAGGGKGGSDFDPKNKSLGEVRRFCQSFMEELHRHIGPETDIPAGDIGVGVREIGFLYGHYVKILNMYSGVLTGKHPNFGGSYVREEATGYGCVYFLKSALDNHNKKIEKSTATVSGSGNVALHTVEKLLEEKVIVQTVSDSDGTLYFKDGISDSDLDKLKQMKFKERARLKEWQGCDAKFYENEKPWRFDSQFAFPCATENEVNATDAKRMIDNGVDVICEGANMPLDKEATELIVSKNLIYLPGKAANAGGVAISGLERSQNRTNWSLTRNEVDSKLKFIMEKIHKNCCENIDKVNGIIPYKAGANLYAFDKVAETMGYLRGK